MRPSIFQQAGEGSIVELTPLKEGSIQDGFVAEITPGVDPDARGGRHGWARGRRDRPPRDRRAFDGFPPRWWRDRLVTAVVDRHQEIR